MAKLSDKYIAGFFDADGSVSVVFVAATNLPQLRVGFSQKTDQDEVLSLIHKEWGGCLDYTFVKGVSYTRLTWSGNKQCRILLNRIKPYTVIKRHYIETCLDICERHLEREEIPRVREYLKVHRKVRSLPLPKHPTRKWLAGYIDGDGCISITKIHPVSGVPTMVLHIAASVFDTEGIETVHKVLGGAIHPMAEGRVRQYVLALQPSKITELFGEIWQHMVVKRDQAELILKCAAMGHLRDGENIKAALKHLKAQPHRLNEPKPDVQSLFETIRDVPKYTWGVERLAKAHEALRVKRQSGMQAY